MTEVLTETARPVPEHRYRVVNRSLKRPDAREKLAGSTRYAADYDLPGMLHAKLVRAPMPSARIVRRDVGAAARLDGVVAVLLGEDVPNNHVFVNVPGQQVEVGALRASSYVLATDRVRFHGEPVALIVARDVETLAEAEMLIDIEYEELPCLHDAERALDPEAPLVHEAGNLTAAWDIDTGDVDAAFSTADIVVEGQYHAQVVDHAYLEPEAGVGWLDDEGVINIRASTQVVEHFRDVANILDIPHSKVRVTAPYLGGGFGGKEDMTVEPYIGVAVFHTGSPVKMVWSRQESLLARPKRHPVRMRYRTAARSDGTLLAHDVDMLSDAGAYPLLSAYVLLYITINATGPYRCDNVRIRSRAVYTNNTPCSAFRGFGGMQPVLGYEAQIDKVAHVAGIDAVEIRKRNAIHKGDRIPVGQRLDTAVWLPQCIDTAVDAAGPPPVARDERFAVGRGLACNMQSYGRLVWLNDSASCWIGFELDGSVTVRCGVPDVGGGQVASLAQITAEVLSVDLDKVTVHFGDSARTPLAGTTTATRQLYMSGNATLRAATRLREQVLEAVAEATGTSAGDASLSSGGVTTADGVIPLPEALAMCVRMERPVHALASFYAPRGKEVGQQLKTDRIFPDATFGAHVADVEVDRETGAVKVLNYVACHDVGRAINPTSVVGQISGAVVQGLGYALSERVVYQEAVNVTTAFFSYAMPTSADVPDITVKVLESGEGAGPFGARGIGEPPIGPCASAVAAAIENAIAVRPATLPILAEDIVGYLSTRGCENE